MYYTPPTIEVAIQVAVPPLNRYRITTAQSIVRVDGGWRAMSAPADIRLSGLTEGIDYFIGGHEYTVTPDLADELAQAGYPSGAIPHFTYGSGPYGDGGYGGSDG